MSSFHSIGSVTHGYTLSVTYEENEHDPNVNDNDPLQKLPTNIQIIKCGTRFAPKHAFFVFETPHTDYPPARKM